MEAEELISKQVLQDKLDQIRSSLLRKHWSYYHVEGVQNFIYHLDSFHSDRIRNKIAKDILQYLCKAEEKVNLNYEPRSSMKELFPVFSRLARFMKMS